MKILTIIFLLITAQAFAQWQPDLRLTNNPSNSETSHNNARCITSSGDTLHVLWHDNRDGNYEIYYKRSTNGGSGWGADTRLTNNSFYSGFSSVSVSGQVVHVVWLDQRDGNSEIYYKRSTDGGSSWEADTRLTNNSLLSEYPSVSVSGQVVHVVWVDSRDGNTEIYYKRSSDGGSSWGADTRLTSNSSLSVDPSISVSGQVIHIVFYDNRDGNYEIYYKRSSDGGSSWGADTRLTNNVLISGRPSIAISGQFVHVLWHDNRDGNYEIYYKRSSDEGLSWEADTRMTNNSSLSEYPTVSVSGQVVHAVWHDNRDGNPEIYYKRSIDGGSSWGADTRLTNSTNSSYYPSVVISGQAVHVVWSDMRDGNSEIYYKRDPTGNFVGIQNISNEIPNGFSLEQNYPNPFNPVTNINFNLPKAGNVKLVVFDALGKQVADLVNGQYNAGSYKVDFNASFLSSGMYFYKIETEGFTDVKKMMLVK
jgi:hypothetical protein